MYKVQGHEGRYGEMLGLPVDDAHMYSSPLAQEEEGMSEVDEEEGEAVMKCSECSYRADKKDWHKGQCRSYCTKRTLPVDSKWGYLAPDGQRYMEVSQKATCFEPSI